MLLLIFCYLFFPISDSLGTPCNNKVSLISAYSENQVGVIEISVASSGNYRCTLNIEEGSGLRQVSEKKGSGPSKVKFSGLSPNPIYLIQVEFLDEENTSRCKKLQLSQLVIK